MSVVQSEDTIPTGNLTLDNYATLLSNRLYLSAILRSFIVGVASGVIVVVLAYPLAYFLVRTTSRWKNLLIALSLAPLLASVIVRTYGWWVVLNREGALNVALRSLGAIDQPLIMLPSTSAIVIGLAHALLPYGVLTIMASLNGLNPNLERAAMSLGAGRVRTFLAVTLPLTAPGIARRLSAHLRDRDERVCHARDPRRPDHRGDGDDDPPLHARAARLVARFGDGRHPAGQRDDPAAAHQRPRQPAARIVTGRTALVRFEARGRLHLPVHAGPDPDHRVGGVQSGQSLVLPATRLFVAVVGGGVRAAVAAAAAVQPGTRDADRTDLRCRRRAAGLCLPALSNSPARRWCARSRSDR